MDEEKKETKFDDLTREGPAPQTFIDRMATHAFKIMMVGFSIAVVCCLIVVVFKTNAREGFSKLVPLYCGFSGFGIYVIGRVLLSRHRKTRKKYLETLSSTSEDAE